MKLPFLKKSPLGKHEESQLRHLVSSMNALRRASSLSISPTSKRGLATRLTYMADEMPAEVRRIVLSHISEVQKNPDFKLEDLAMNRQKIEEILGGNKKAGEILKDYTAYTRALINLRLRTFHQPTPEEQLVADLIEMSRANPNFHITHYFLEKLDPNSMRPPEEQVPDQGPLFDVSKHLDADQIVKEVKERIKGQKETSKAEETPEEKEALVNELWDKGEALYRRKKYRKAKRHFKEVLELNPDHQLAHHFLGCIYRAKGDLEDAKKHFQKALELDTENDLAYTELSNIYRKQGDLGSARNIIQAGLALHPQSGYLHWSLAIVYEEQGDFESAKAHFEKAFELDSSNPLHKKYLEEINAKIAEVNKAQETPEPEPAAEKEQIQVVCDNCSTIYQFSPDAIPSEGYDAQCTQCQSVFFVSPGGAKHVITTTDKEADEIAEREKQTEELWDQVRAAERQNDIETAEKILLSIIELNPKRPSAQLLVYTYLGEMFEGQGDLENAKKYFEKALELNSDIGRYRALARVCEKQGNLESAKIYFQKALELNPLGPIANEDCKRIEAKIAEASKAKESQQAEPAAGAEAEKPKEAHEADKPDETSEKIEVTCDRCNAVYDFLPEKTSDEDKPCHVQCSQCQFTFFVSSKDGQRVGVPGRRPLYSSPVTPGAPVPGGGMERADKEGELQKGATFSLPEHDPELPSDDEWFEEALKESLNEPGAIRRNLYATNAKLVNMIANEDGPVKRVFYSAVARIVRAIT